MIDDLRIREFKNNLINYMNEEPLPLEVKRLVLSDILNETIKAVDANIKAYLMAEKEKTNSENSPE